MLEKLALLKIALCSAPGLEQRLFGLLARGVVGADQQVADDGVLRVAQRRDRHHRREAAAVLADVGQLVDVLDPARGLEHQRLEAGRDRRAELDAERLGARDHFLRIGDVGRRDLVHHLGGRVAQHPLGADVEDLDDALGVGGDAREVGAVEDRALQGARFQQGDGAEASIVFVFPNPVRSLQPHGRGRASPAGCTLYPDRWRSNSAAERDARCTGADGRVGRHSAVPALETTAVPYCTPRALTETEALHDPRPLDRGEVRGGSQG